MSETMDKKVFPEQLSEILLVLDKKKMKIQAVKSIDENGKMETVDPTKKNQNQFMRVDKHGDFISNFFSNFFRQLKDPTRFSFFKVSADEAINKANELQKQIDNPTPEGEELMKKHEVKAEPQQEHKQENQNNMETTQTTPGTGEYRYKPEQIDWETMSNLGLSKEKLEKMNLLDPLLKGYKTNELVPVSLNLGSAITRMDARLSLQSNDNGQVMVAIHGIRKEPNLYFKFFGHEFSKEDKQNLLKTGNMGRIVDLTNPKTGETISSIVSVDRLTNELIALRSEYIKIPDEIKGVKLDEQQKQTLSEGRPLYIEGMISKKGDPFDATVQFNADKRYVEFLFDRSNTNRQAATQNQNQSTEAPRVFRGKELDDEQYQKFKDGQTVYVDGFIDKKGKEYNGYITFNKETGKTGFAFPSQVKAQEKPAETDKAAKNIKDKKQQEQQEKPKAPARSKGRKM